MVWPHVGLISGLLLAVAGGHEWHCARVDRIYKRASDCCPQVTYMYWTDAHRYPMWHHFCLPLHQISVVVQTARTRIFNFYFKLWNASNINTMFSQFSSSLDFITYMFCVMRKTECNITSSCLWEETNIWWPHETGPLLHNLLHTDLSDKWWAL